MKLSSGMAWFLALLGGLALAWFLSQTNTGAAITAGTPTLTAPSPGDAPASARSDAAVSNPQIYRWRDANGNLNASTEPPPPGVKYTVHTYREDQNVVPSGGGVVGR